MLVWLAWALSGCSGEGELTTEPPPESESIEVTVDPTHQDTTVTTATLFNDATGSQVGTGRTTLEREEGTTISVRVEAEGFETTTSTVSFNTPHTETITLSAVAPQSFTLEVANSSGAVVSPDGLAGEYEPGTSVSYTVSLADGFENLLVQLDGAEASASDTIVMDQDHQLAAAADTVVEMATEDQHLVDEMRQVIEASDPMDAYRTLRASVDELAQRKEPAEVARTLREARALAYDPVEDAAATREAIQAIAQSLDGSASNASQITSASGAAAAESGLENASGDGVRFIYVNGILTSPADIRATVETPNLLPRLMEAAGLSGSQYPLTQFYNRSAQYIDDGSLDTLICMERKGDLAASGRDGSLFERFCDVLGGFEDLQEAGQQVVNGVLGTLPELAQSDAVRLADTIQSVVQSGWPVVVVGHSQGNLMADEALEVLADRENSVDLACVGAVSIAPPRRIHRDDSTLDRRSVILAGNRYEDILHYVGKGEDATHVDNVLSRTLDDYEDPYEEIVDFLLGEQFDPAAYWFGFALHKINSSYLTQGESAETLIEDHLSDQASAVLEHCESGEASNEPPSASISAPADGSTFTEGDTVAFEGSASDPDGSVTSVRWQSDMDGELGTTLSFTRNDLSVGTHSITLEAVDDSGATSSDTVSVSVETSTASGMWSQVSASDSHTCGIAKSGNAYCWGSDFRERLGNGEESGSSDIPDLVQGGHSWAQISTAAHHTCAVTTSGDAYCWGRNDEGVLGIGAPQDSILESSRPALVVGGHTWSSVSAGDRHTCGVTRSGDAYCWGDNDDNMLGIGESEGETSNTHVPALVVGGHQWASVSAGNEHTCGVTTDGDAYCWGMSLYGQLGAGDLGGEDPDSPVLVKGGHAWITVKAGDIGGTRRDHTCGVTDGGAAYCWGDNLFGQLGDGSSDDADIPVLVAGGREWSSVSATDAHSCGVTVGGDGYCWGHNLSGQLGDGSDETSYTPVLVSGDHSWKHVNAGTDHTCGVTTEGEAYCWGAGGGGALGHGSVQGSEIPVLVSNPNE